MANDPYNDPNRIARQMAERANQTAQQMFKNSQRMADDSARNARLTAERNARDSFERSRKSFQEQQARNDAFQASKATDYPSWSVNESRKVGGGRTAGRLIGWFLGLGLLAYAAWRMFGL